MQYPQIQFYRGSLVRLASGKLKQVEDLSSDDFLESARLARSSSTSLSSLATINGGNTSNHYNSQQQPQLLVNGGGGSSSGNGGQSARQQVRRPGSAAASASFTAITSGNGNHHVDENNNSVFNSPEPTPSFDSPTMDMMETDDMGVDDYINRHDEDDQDNNNDDDDEELDVVSCNQVSPSSLLTSRQKFSSQIVNNNKQQQLSPNATPVAQNPDDDLYIDSSVVRDFLEVGPPSSASPPNSANSHHYNSHQDLNQFSLGPSTSSSNSNSPGGLSRSHVTNFPVQPINLTGLVFVEPATYLRQIWAQV